MNDELAPPFNFVRLLMKRLKQRLQTLKKRVYELIGKPGFSKPALYDFDEKLAKYLDYRNGFFIEAGANDGITQSNTYYLEKTLGWKGVLVEAIPDLFNECKKIRKNGFLYNYALVANDFTESTVEIHCINLMSVVEGARKNSQAQAEYINEGIRIQNLTDYRTLNVPARTLESILDEFAEPLTIDFFSLDVEGYELNVLKGINLEKYRPKYILVEADFFDEVNDFLKDKYTLIEQLSFHDYLYELREEYR